MTARPLCPTTCPHYVRGEPGLRYCRRRHFDERSNSRKPLLTQDLQILKPWECQAKDKRK